MAARRIYPGKHQTLKLVGPLECCDCVLLGAHNEPNGPRGATCTKAARINNLDADNSLYFDS